MAWVTEQESLAKYGTPAYTGWDAPSAQADWNAKHPGAAPTATTTGGTTGQVALNSTSLLQAITGEPQGYEEAVKAEEARLPLIQQRYKALLDEINQATEAGKKGYEKAGQEQLSETQQRVADAISTILAQGTVQKAKAVAGQAEEEAGVASNIANLKIAKGEAKTKGYTTALDYLLQSKGSAGEQSAATSRSNLVTDIKNGLNFENVVKKYANTGLDISEVVTTYDNSSPYKGHQESWDTIQKWWNSAKVEPSTSVEADTIDRQAKGQVLSNAGYKSGSMTNADITATILSAGGDPNNSFFAELYENNPANKVAEVSPQTQQAKDFFKNLILTPEGKAKSYWL
jgi:hypothetical protein